MIPASVPPSQARPSENSPTSSAWSDLIDWDSAHKQVISEPRYDQRGELIALTRSALSVIDLKAVQGGIEWVYGRILLLRIPSLYFSRVARIFEDAQTSLPNIRRMARARASQWKTPNEIMTLADLDPAPLPNSLIQLKASWEEFIDSLMREWKTLNLVSVLLIAILTLLQIDSASHPITRTTALFSLICSLMSLLYGCIYIIRFGTLRKMHKASSFAKAVGNVNGSSVNVWWNVFVMLAMPSTWLAWAIIAFIGAIMSFVWLSSAFTPAALADTSLSRRANFAVSSSLSVVLLLGIIYFVFIVRELRRYGDAMDREWMKSVMEDSTTAGVDGLSSMAPSVRNQGLFTPGTVHGQFPTSQWMDTTPELGYSRNPSSNPAALYRNVSIETGSSCSIGLASNASFRLIDATRSTQVPATSTPDEATAAPPPALPLTANT
ncbi:hypothetical protein MKEN_00852100 [Mycena kentingensis (nom. inval.)]|nr:hypothetical protein MKEN_00852100 [Mycena kentingensis (nom. inval.)]